MECMGWSKTACHSLVKGESRIWKMFVEGLSSRIAEIVWVFSLKKLFTRSVAAIFQRLTPLKNPPRCAVKPMIPTPNISTGMR